MVHNDSTYGAIKNIQKRAHGARYRDVELNNPDFLKLAAAFGVPASRAPMPRASAMPSAPALDPARAVADRGPRSVAADPGREMTSER